MWLDGGKAIDEAGNELLVLPKGQAFWGFAGLERVR